MDNGFVDLQGGTVKTMTARIAELEAEIKRLNEAGKVLAMEIAGWRCGGIRFMDNKPGYGTQSIGVQKLKYFGACKSVDNNPTAAAWVREVSNA